MNVLSLFDGIAAGYLALERADLYIGKYYASEIDTNAMKVAKKNHGDLITHIGSVTQIEDSFEPGEIDIIIGGSPCQGFSKGGHMLGFDDPDSKLIEEYLHFVEYLKPKFFLLENVQMGQKRKDYISWRLGVEPIKINSSLVSAQQRRRLYWTNIPGVKQPEDLEIDFQSVLSSGFTDRYKSLAIDATYNKGINLKGYVYANKRQIVFEDEDFMNWIMKEKPDINIINEIGQAHRHHWRLLNTRECERLQTLPAGYTARIRKSDRYQLIGNSWTVDVIAHILRNIHDS